MVGACTYIFIALSGCLLLIINTNSNLLNVFRSKKELYKRFIAFGVRRLVVVVGSVCRERWTFGVYTALCTSRVSTCGTYRLMIPFVVVTKSASLFFHSTNS